MNKSTLHELLQQWAVVSTSVADQLVVSVEPEHYKHVARQLLTNSKLCCEQLMDLCVVDMLTYGQGEWETQQATCEGYGRAIVDQSFENQVQPKQVLNELLDVVPDAKSVRSHSLFHSERLVDVFYDFGLSHISNCFIPYGAGIDVRPFSIWENMVMVPHCWQDNVALRMDLAFPDKSELLKSHFVFNFHPIHIFLNTEKVERYELSRPFHQDPDKLISKRFNGVGTRTLLIDLLEVLKDLEEVSKKTISL